MDIWSILKIAETDDKAKIRRAYRARLREVHPEDDPEGFKTLREAYEKALSGEKAEARQPLTREDRQREEAEKALEKLYASYRDRIDPWQWKALLDTDYFTMLDTSEEGMHVILGFLLKHLLVPRSVIRLICDRYTPLEREDELSDRYPRAFFTYLDKRLSRPDQVEMELVRGPEGADYDSYIDGFFGLQRAVMEGNREMELSFLQKLRQTDIQYPGLDERVGRYLLQTGRIDEAERLAENLTGAYPFFEGWLLRADIMQLRNRKKKMRRCLDMCQSIRKDDPAVVLRIARLDMAEENFETARDLAIQEIRKNPYDIYMRNLLVTAAAGLKEQLKEKAQENPDDNTIKMEWGKACYQARQFPEVVKVFTSFHPTDEELPEYLNYMGRTYLSMQKTQDAVLAFETWLRVTEGLPGDHAEKKKRDQVLELLASAYMEGGDLEASERTLDQAAGTDPEDREVLQEARIELTYRKQDYMNCIRLCQKRQTEKRNSYTAALYHAKSAIRVGMAEEALYYARLAAEIYPYMVGSHEVMARVLILAGKRKEAGEVLDRYESMGIQSATCAYLRAVIAREENRLTEAFMTLLRAEELVKDRDSCDMRHPEEFYILKGELMEGLKDPHKALAAYEEALKINPEQRRIQGLLGVLLMKLHRFREAEPYLTGQIEKSPEPLHLITRGMCYRETGDPEKAEKDYLRVLADPNAKGKTMVFIGDQFREMRFFDRAGYSYERALEKELGNADRRKAIFGMAVVLAETKKGKEAKQLLMDLSQGQAVSTEIKVVLARIAMREGETREAESILRSLLMYEMHDRAAYYDLLAELYFRSGDVKGLETSLQEAAGEKAASYRQMILLGRLYLWLEDWKKAENILLAGEDQFARNSAESALLLAEAASHQFASRGRVSRYLELMHNRNRTTKDPVVRQVLEVRGLLLQGKLEQAGRDLAKILSELRWEGEYSTRAYHVYLTAADMGTLAKDNRRALVYSEEALSAYGSHVLLEKKCEELKKK